MATLQEVLRLAKQLSLIDKLRLIEQITPTIEQEITTIQNSPRRSLWGLCADLGTAPSASDIDQARAEAWVSFPREDV